MFYVYMHVYVIWDDLCIRVTIYFLFIFLQPPQKGKQGTKGAKQIVEENIATLAFYRYMIFGSAATYLVLMTVLSEGFGFWDIVSNWIVFTKLILVLFWWQKWLFYNDAIIFLQTFFLFAAAIFTASIQFMRFMARSKYSETNQLLDSGVDLNMESGVAE